MAQFSHSRVDSFKQCPYKYKLRYVDRIKTIPADNADNALYLGTAIHTGIEKGVEAGVKAYYDCFPVIDDLHINEVIKLEYLIPKVREVLPDGEYERAVSSEHFVSFLDLLTPNEDGTYDLYDFKYSNNIKNYMESGQLHEYKFFFESTTGKKIRKMYFVFIPKVQIKQKKTENLLQFRQRIQEELQGSEVTIKEIEFDYTKVIEFYEGIKTILEAKEFPKNPTYFCNWCEYQDYCMKGIDYMLLPSNERRNIETIEKKVAWFYGAPFSGKTYLANQFPDPLMLNTDGNIKFVDAPYISIKDKVVVEGRQTKRTLAWEVFKEVISELEKKQNEFKTLVVDLLEDAYEHCRIFIYDREVITHESDNSFKYYDVVRTEFLSTLKRLMNLDYENIILISHEDTSKDITKKSGDKITSIKPNLTEKVANKVAGMVDIVARVVANGDERTLSFKTNEVIFGGGRLTVSEKIIPLDYDQFMQVYAEANANKNKISKPAAPSEKTSSRTRKSKDTPAAEAPAEEKVEKVEAEPVEEVKNFTQEVQDAEPKQEEPSGRRSRKSRSKVEPIVENSTKSAEAVEAVESAEPAKKTRKRREA